MKNSENKFPSQQQASAQLKEKIDAVRAKKQEQLKKYGSLMIDTEPKLIHTDLHGNILNQEDIKELRDKGLPVVK